MGSGVTRRTGVAGRAGQRSTVVGRRLAPRPGRQSQAWQHAGGARPVRGPRQRRGRPQVLAKADATEDAMFPPPSRRAAWPSPSGRLGSATARRAMTALATPFRPPVRPGTSTSPRSAGTSRAPVAQARSTSSATATRATASQSHPHSRPRSARLVDPGITGLCRQSVGVRQLTRCSVTGAASSG